MNAVRYYRFQEPADHIRVEGGALSPRAVVWPVDSTGERIQGVTITVGIQPLDAITRTLLPLLGAPLSLDLAAYSVHPKVLAGLEALRAAGQMTGRYLLDRRRSEGLEHLPAFVVHLGEHRVRYGDVHHKRFCWSGPKGITSLLSSANDGRERNHVEWWFASPDAELHRWLVAEGAPDASVSWALDACWEGGGVLQIPSGGPSSLDILDACLRRMDGPVSLDVVTMGGAVGGVEQLAEWYESGRLASLRYVMDPGVASLSTGHRGDVPAALEARLPGCYHVSAGVHIHAKYAVLRAGGQVMSVLTTQNWQRSSPRSDYYLLLPSAAIAEGLQRLTSELWHERLTPEVATDDEAPMVDRIRAKDDGRVHLPQTPEQQALTSLRRASDGPLGQRDRASLEHIMAVLYPAAMAGRTEAIKLLMSALQLSGDWRAKFGERDGSTKDREAVRSRLLDPALSEEDLVAMWQEAADDAE